MIFGDGQEEREMEQLRRALQICIKSGMAEKSVTYRQVNKAGDMVWITFEILSASEHSKREDELLGPWKDAWA